MREIICDVLNVIQEMNRKYELKTLEKKGACIQKSIDEFTLKILFTGGFSAGKSALINAIIGEELLEEGQRPETAIASEIMYDTKEYVEAVNGDTKERYVLEDISLIDVKKYDYLIWHLNREELKKYKECIIVDMPGFNSGIQEHNKAILQYAGKGDAYILVIDCDDGAIKYDINNFIDEIKNYENNMAIVVTKCDLKPEKDIIRIKDNIEENAELLFGENMPIVTTSKYDDSVKVKMEKLINNFDREMIFQQEFVPQIYENGMRCINSMETYRKSIRLDLSQFDEEIARHERTKKELSDKLKREKGKLEKRFRNSVEPAIIADVENALYSRTNELTNSLKAGEKSFSITVNNILRPVLLASTQRYVEQSFDKFMTEIDFSDADIDISVQGIGADVLEKYHRANSKIQEIARNSDKYNAIYKTITTALAVATNVVAPWLELLLIFLPDVLKMFGMGNKKGSLKNKVNDEIIPQIVDKMRSEIMKTLMEMKEDMIQQAEEEIRSLIDSEMESLEAAKSNKEKTNVEYNEKIDEVQHDIDEIRNLIEQIL